MSPSTTRDTAFKWTAYALAILLLALLHQLTAARVTLFGVTPFLPPLLLAVICSMEPRLEASVFALVFGMACDLALVAPLPCLYTVSFVAAALLTSFLAQSLIQPGLLCSLVTSAAAFALVDLLVAAYFFVSGRAELTALLSRAARELLVSLPLLLVCHPTLAYLHRRFTL